MITTWCGDLRSWSKELIVIRNSPPLKASLKYLLDTDALSASRFVIVVCLPAYNELNGEDLL